MKKVLYLILCFVASTQLLAAELNTWTHYFAYNNLTHVVPTKDYVFAVSTGRLFSYAPGKVVDSQIYAYNTTNLLSDHNDIKDILYVQATNNLVIVYEGGNIDLLDIARQSVTNIPHIKNYNTTRSKNILDISSNGRNVYFTLQWGIAILNTQKKEITDNFVITEDESDNNTINGSIILGDSIYVTSSTKKIPGYSNTVIRANLKSNLLDKNNWSDKFTTERCNAICNAVKDAKQSRNIYNVSNPNAKNTALIADTYRDCYWGSNSDNILMEYQKEGTQYQEVGTPKKPYGPSSNNIFNMQFKYNNLYCISRGWNTDIPMIYSPNNGVVQTYNSRNGTWNTFETPSFEKIGHTYTHTNNLAIDPRDTSHVMVGGNEGIYEFYGGKFIKHYDNTNSPILPFKDESSKTYQMILGLIYDNNNRLWVLNTYCSRGIIALDQSSPRDTTTANNIWHTFSKHPEIDTFTPNERYLARPFFESNGMMWFLNNNYQDGTFYNYDPSTDVLTQHSPNINQDGSNFFEPSGYNTIRDIKEDRSGNIWIATSKGIAYIKAENKYNASENIIQHKVNRNDGTGLADYLLSTVDASCIIFDTANRMYVGTLGNGVYVISADRNTEIRHYTTETSSIMSDNVYYLALNDATGELYISTDKGLCSVTTDAIEVPESLEKDNIVVYPNPVTPEYAGLITIEGLTVGASIIITNTAGAVVHRGRSTSAMYQWDGCDLNGDRCASGVYNVLLAGQDGSKGCVGKIAMVK